MFSDGENTSVLEVEVEALQSIYLDELDVQLDESGAISIVSIQLYPATAHIVEEQYVTMFLSFKIPEEYPDSIPEISIHNTRGLLDEQIYQITDNLLEIAENKKGSSMLYELIEAAKQQLTDANRPSEDCAICLYGFFDEDVFMKTECYHYFHSHCLSRYVQCKLEEKKKEEEEKSSIEQDEIDTSKNVPCPVCRVPISFDSTRDDFPEPVGVSDAIVDIDSIALDQQHEMNMIYKKQLEQGGIIDLEAESRKYLLEISNVPDVPINETGNMKVSSCTSKENTADVSNGSSPGVRNKRSPHSTVAKSAASNLVAKGGRNWKSKYQSTEGPSDWTECGEDSQKTGDVPNEYDVQGGEQESPPPRGHRNAQNFRQRGGRPQRGPRFGGNYQNDTRYIPRNNGYRQGNSQSGYRQGASQSGYRQSNSQGGYRQGSYRQGNSQGGYRQGNSQGGYRQGDSQGGFRQGNSQGGGYRQGNSQSSYRQGNSQGGYRQGNFQSSRPYNRRNRVNDHFRSGFDENDTPDFKEDSHNPSPDYSLDASDSKRMGQFSNEDSNHCEGSSQDQESSSAERLDSQSQASEHERTSHSSARNDDWSSREEEPDHQRDQRRNNFRPKPQYPRGRGSGKQYQNYRNKSEESDATLQDALCSSSDSRNEKSQRYLGNRNNYRNNGGYDSNQHDDRRRNPNWKPRYNNSGPRHNYKNETQQLNRNSYQDRDMQGSLINPPEEIPKCSVSNGCSSLEKDDNSPKVVESNLTTQSPAVVMPVKVPQDQNSISQENELKIMCSMAGSLRSPPGFANPHKKVVYGLPSVNPPPGFGQS